jgi:hypothetical protein
VRTENLNTGVVCAEKSDSGECRQPEALNRAMERGVLVQRSMGFRHIIMGGNEISRRVVPRERLGDLARDQLRGWVCRHAKRRPKSSPPAHNDKTIQNLECDRRQDKEIDRRDAVDVIAEKRPPAVPVGNQNRTYR